MSERSEQTRRCNLECEQADAVADESPQEAGVSEKRVGEKMPAVGRARVRRDEENEIP